MNNQLAQTIDHTLLKAEATEAELIKLCEEAKTYKFASVCVNSSNIPLVARLLKNSAVNPIAVVGFPLGAASSQTKAYEAKEAILAGAKEIDMVINLGALKSKEYQTVFEDIKQVVTAAHPYPVKVIIETASLTNQEKIAACVLAQAARAHFVKTSTGFGGGGASVEDLTLIRSIIGQGMRIKASGGIRTKEDAEKMVAAGADRLGTSAGIAIVTDGETKTVGY